MALPVGVALVDAEGARLRSTRPSNRFGAARGPRCPFVRQTTPPTAHGGPTRANRSSPKSGPAPRQCSTASPSSTRNSRSSVSTAQRAFVLNGAAPIRDAKGRIVGAAVAIKTSPRYSGREGPAREREPLPHAVRHHDRGLRPARDHQRRGRPPLRLPLPRREPGLRAAHRAEARRHARPHRAGGAAQHRSLLDREFGRVALAGEPAHFEN